MPRQTIRFTDAQMAELEELSGGNISDFIRSKLFDQSSGVEAAVDRIEHLAEDVEDLLRGLSDAPKGENALPLMAEILLILRATVKPETIRKAQAELKRNGISPWTTE